MHFRSEVIGHFTFTKDEMLALYALLQSKAVQENEFLQDLEHELSMLLTETIS